MPTVTHVYTSAGVNTHSYTYGMGDWWTQPPKPLVRGGSEGSHILACARYPVRKLMGYDANGNLDPNSKRNVLPLKYVEALEQNQQLASCCRHPENHEVEAWFSCEADYEKGVPDIYKNYCTCGRVHVRFCVGGGDQRPFWDVR